MTDFDDAIASAEAELGGDPVPDPTPDPTPEPDPKPEVTPDPKPDPDPDTDPPTEEPKADAEQDPKEDELEDALDLSPETLSKINESPELQAVYRSMQGGLTKKFQAVAESAKTNEKNLNLVEWIRQNPLAARDELNDVIKKQGLDTTPEPTPAATDDAVDDITKRWTEQLGPNTNKILRPVIEDTIKYITENMLKDQLDPIKERLEADSKAATERGFSSAVDSFGAQLVTDGKEWTTEIANEMAELLQGIEPAKGTSLDSLLGTGYSSVMYARHQKNTKRAELKRLRDAKANSEPNSPVRPDPPASTKITPSMADDAAFAAAVEQAERELA